MIAVLEQQVRENYEELLKNSTVDKSKDCNSMIYIFNLNLDELWNLYLDFCIQRLSQASDSNKNEVKTKVKTFQRDSEINFYFSILLHVIKFFHQLLNRFL